jgi:protein-S-isoprenylcysteine O-methyltransferase Ste14
MLSRLAGAAREDRLWRTPLPSVSDWWRADFSSRFASRAVVLLGAFAQFAIQGRGTPAPPAPTEQLVVRGLYRYVRNPMYLAVLAVITGQALLLSRPVLLGYAAAVAAAVITFVHGYEQPTLARRHGAQYQAYRKAVPGWWPRLPPARKTPRP